MSGQRHRREELDFNLDNDDYAGDEKRRGRSRSRSRSRRRRHRDDSRSRSRSRNRSVERHRRRHRNSKSRSRSNSRTQSSRHERRHGARRHRNSRSRSRSGSHSRSRNHNRHRGDNGNEKYNNTAQQQQQTQHQQPQHNMIMTEESNVSNASSSNSTDQFSSSLHDLPLPKRRNPEVGAYYHLDTDEPIDKARIHREMEEKLRETLAKEGKIYPPPKAEASHPVFANDGSFLEIFKKMQEAQQKQQLQQHQAPTALPTIAPTAAATASTSTTATASKQVLPPPIVGRRRGGKILKTGVVAKPKAQTENNADPKDFWSLYLAEVNKYKNNACESDGGTRPLVK